MTLRDSRAAIEDVAGLDQVRAAPRQWFFSSARRPAGGS
jgi:hypothetical protein